MKIIYDPPKGTPAITLHQCDKEGNITSFEPKPGKEVEVPPEFEHVVNFAHIKKVK